MYPPEYESIKYENIDKYESIDTRIQITFKKYTYELRNKVKY